MPSSLIVSPFEQRLTQRRLCAPLFVAVIGFIGVCVPDMGFAQAITSSIPVGAFPFGIAVNEVTNRIYVNNVGGNSVSVIDGSTGSAVTAASVPSPDGIAVNSQTNKIYVISGSSSSVAILDGATNSVANATAGSVPNDVKVNTVTNKIYVANENSANVTVIDGATNAASTIQTGGARLNGIGINSVTNKIYVSNGNSNTVTVIDGATNAVSTVATLSGPNAIGVNSTTNKIYVADYTASSVTVIDGATNATTTIAVGLNPTAIAVNPSTNKIYVANNGSDNLTVIDGATGATITLGTGTKPVGVAINALTNRIYVANNGSNNVTVVNGATNQTTTVAVGTGPNAIAVNASTDRVYVANGASNDVTVISEPSGVPSFTSQPQSQTVEMGSPVVFAVQVGSSSGLTFRWSLNGAPLADTADVIGSSTAMLYVGGSSAANMAGVFACTATTPAGTAVSNPATLSVVTSPTPGRLINISSRAFVGTGDKIMIAGFAVAGSGSKTVLLRGIGPALANFQVTGSLPSPVLSLFDSAVPANLITEDTGWSTAPSLPAGPWKGLVVPASATPGDFSQANAFALSPGSGDSAIKVTVPAGNYTSQIAGGTGVALAEIYDMDASNSPTQILNISSRAFVGTGSNLLIAGFVISGSTSQTVLIRASGPALSALGVSGTIPDPELELFDASQNLVSSEFGWGGSRQVSGVAKSVGAFTWSDPASNDSAILVTLPPGSYTAQASGKSGDTGVALIEVYAVR
jgi:YVTN family beta-propeller protein